MIGGSPCDIVNVRYMLRDHCYDMTWPHAETPQVLSPMPHNNVHQPSCIHSPNVHMTRIYMYTHEMWLISEGVTCMYRLQWSYTQCAFRGMDTQCAFEGMDTQCEFEGIHSVHLEQA